MPFLIDMGILNTMTNEYTSAQTLLSGSGISILDAARLIRNALDAMPKNGTVSPLQFCSQVVETGKRHIRTVEMDLKNGFAEYVKTKGHLRHESLRDIRYLGGRLMKSATDIAGGHFSEISAADCERWLSMTFRTPSQFNKGRAMLHALFEFSIRRGWCDKNPVKPVPRRKVTEREIRPLSIAEIKRLLTNARNMKCGECSAAAGLLVWAGMRPGEVRRLTWKDIDLEENAVTVRSQCSKTGGVRHVEICPALRGWLKNSYAPKNMRVCPPGWARKWKALRDSSGFKGTWVQDVLRHTFASYHAKHFRDLPRLQIDMGHRDQTLLRSRYVNMRGISKSDAANFQTGFFMRAPHFAGN